jgi:membrane protein DedA with SNARE-associated domain
LGSPLTISNLKKKTPIIIAIAIAIILVTYIVLELLADTFVKGAPGTGISLTRTVASWGYSGIFSLMILEASSLPIPSEMILPFAGYLVSSGYLDFWITLIVATVAAVIGSLIDYYIGLKGVQALTKYRLLGKAIVSENQLKVAANYFSKYGSVMVLVGRLIPIVRTLISFPAGAVRMPLAKFISYTLVGCILWNSLLIYIGYYLGGNWQEVADFAHYIVIAVVVVVAIAFAVYLVRRKNRNKKAGPNSISPSQLT